MSVAGKNKFWIFPISIAVILAAMSFRGVPVKDSSKLVLHFVNYVGDKKLVLDTVQYKNSLGQYFKVSNFKYYICNVELTAADGKVYKAKDSYYLVNEEDAETGNITLADIPRGDYKKLNFLIGVDSLHNCSGAQEGALDPVNAMFWTWNTGYIFMKLEGRSPSSKSPGGMYEYHIGGYREPFNSIRKIEIDLTGSTIEPSVINNVTCDQAGAKYGIWEIYIDVDASKIMDSNTKIDISKLSSVTDLHNAPTIADNYKNMFSLLKLYYGCYY